MDTLGKLFGGADKVKLMRLFLFNPELVFATKEVSRRSKITQTRALKELKVLHHIGLISKRSKNRATLWQLERSFPNLQNLKVLVRGNLISRKKDLARQFSRCGQVRLLVASGVLLERNDSRADILVVGDKLRRGALDRLVKELEAEIGRELNYAAMDTADFNYRLAASDRFIRDVFDYPHELLIDKIGVYPQ